MTNSKKSSNSSSNSNELYAIAETSGQQFWFEVNRYYDIDRLNAKEKEKITFFNKISDCQTSKFDTVVCLDVLEHLADPASQIKIFSEIMDSNSIALFNWYFFKGEKNEYPFHIDDIQIVEKFFETIQSNFLEVFHPILITTRAYKKIR